MGRKKGRVKRVNIGFKLYSKKILYRRRRRLVELRMSFGISGGGGEEARANTRVSMVVRKGGRSVSCQKDLSGRGLQDRKEKRRKGTQGMKSRVTGGRGFP